MTRATQVAVTSPGVDPMETWRTMATLIHAPEQYRFTVNSTAIDAAPNQGLCALNDLDHGNGDLIPEDGCDEYCEPTCSGEWCWGPAHYIMARFDTAYSFTDSCGCHSGGLHLRLVAGLGAWLSEQGATWLWWDEEGDGWRHGSDWGTLGDPRGVCPAHRDIPAPPSALAEATR